VELRTVHQADPGRQPEAVEWPQDREEAAVLIAAADRAERGSGEVTSDPAGDRGSAGGGAARRDLTGGGRCQVAGGGSVQGIGVAAANYEQGEGRSGWVQLGSAGPAAYDSPERRQVASTELEASIKYLQGRRRDVRQRQSGEAGGRGDEEHGHEDP
jgi:hypothetical protein